jgi:hypothetical protein
LANGLGESQIMGTIDLSFVPAVLGAKQMGTTLEQLNAQLLTTQTIAKRTGAVFIQDFAGSARQQSVILDQYGRVLSSVGDNTGKLRKATETVDQAAKKHKQTIKDLGDQYNVLGSQFERRAGWFLAGSAMFGSIAAAGAAVKTISDVEAGMTQIARITEDVTFNFNEMRDDLLSLGREYGMVWENAQDVALRFAQAGYNVKDTLELTETAFLALNTAELNAEQAWAA